MPKPHDTSNRFAEVFTLESRTHADIQTALLFDLRRAAERTANATELTAERQRQAIKVLERIDRRLAKRVKLR